MTERLGLSADEVLTTTRAVRKRLDLTRPVERDVLVECVDIALQAPTGSNRQAWHWVFVTDPGKKAAIAAHYKRNFDAYRGVPGPGYKPGDVRGERADAVGSSADYLSEHMHEAPVLVIPCHWGRLPADADTTMQAGFWGSILPAVWSFLLALRERSLGSAWTTLHLPNEAEVAEVLGIPYDRCTQVGLFPVAYTLGTDFKKASRIPADQLVHFDTW